MKLAFLTIFTVFSPLLWAADDPAMEQAQLHLESVYGCNKRILMASYAPKVTLMAGHEYLKEIYGLAGKDGRSKKLEVECEKVIELAMELFEQKVQGREAALKKFLAGLKYEEVELKNGKLRAAAGDVGQMALIMRGVEPKEGDKFFKIFPKEREHESDDFLLLHLRNIDGVWRVVSEYLD